MDFKIQIRSENYLVAVFKIAVDAQAVNFLKSTANTLLDNFSSSILEVSVGLDCLGILLESSIFISDFEHQVADFLKTKFEPATLLNMPSTIHEINVRYEGEDLHEISKFLNLSVSDIIELHQTSTYTVGMIGFLPGFPYLLGLDTRLVSPRKTVPKPALRKGTVAIADIFTGIYPSSSPGGWWEIGYTDFELFSITKNPYTTLQVGDQVIFKAQ
jgi:KipI family sensor histidine kinase inhibitor